MEPLSLGTIRPSRRVVLFRGGHFNAPNLNSQISYLGLAAFLTMTQIMASKIMLCHFPFYFGNFLSVLRTRGCRGSVLRFLMSNVRLGRPLAFVATGRQSETTPTKTSSWPIDARIEMTSVQEEVEEEEEEEWQCWAHTIIVVEQGNFDFGARL